jgi:nicotinate phosphoribosyltransferase
MMKSLQELMPSTPSSSGFWEWLSTVDCSKVRIFSQLEGNFCFPRVPLLRVEGPIAIVQLLETPLLNLVNFATLVTTNAARYRLAVGEKAVSTKKRKQKKKKKKKKKS